MRSPDKTARWRPRIAWLVTFALSGTSAIHADRAAAGEPANNRGREHAPAASSEAAQQRVREDLQATLSQLGASGALGQHPDRIAVRVDEPARRLTSVGALVDSTSAQSAHDGLHVLGATPGSMADRLGLRPGDVIVAVNGASLRDLGADEHGRALAAATLKSVVAALPDDASVQLAVLRGGTTVTLSGPLEPVYLPAMHVELGEAATGVDAQRGVSAGASAATAAPAEAAGGPGCGRISVLDVAPRTEQLYSVRIALLDGVTPGPHGTPSFRVSAGEHQLLVSEDIPTQALGIGEMATLRRKTSKPLTVTVKAGTTALIAAKLHLSNTSDLNHGTYWDPVVWREAAESCP